MMRKEAALALLQSEVALEDNSKEASGMGRGIVVDKRMFHHSTLVVLVEEA